MRDVVAVRAKLPRRLSDAYAYYKAVKSCMRRLVGNIHKVAE